MAALRLQPGLALAVLLDDRLLPLQLRLLQLLAPLLHGLAPVHVLQPQGLYMSSSLHLLLLSELLSLQRLHQVGRVI